MVEFLTTSDTSSRLERIIKEALRELVLVSPYLQISNNLLERLQDADKLQVKITLIYGKDQLKPEESEKLGDLKNLALYYYKNVHAKCFYNENHLIITSMNMYEFSEKTNREMGVFVHREGDDGIYGKAVTEVQSILSHSTKIKIESRGGLTAMGRASDETRPKSPRDLPAVGKSFEEIRPKSPSGLAVVGRAIRAVVNDLVDDKGFCIRCGKTMDYDPDRPLCLNDFLKWNEFKKTDYPENWCHRCGKRRKVSMGRPLCRTCWREDSD